MNLKAAEQQARRVYVSDHVGQYRADQIAEQESIVHTVDADRKAREAEEAQRKLDELHDLGDDVWIFGFSGLNLY